MKSRENGTASESDLGIPVSERDQGILLVDPASSERRQPVLIVRIRVYSSQNQAMGDLEFPADAAHRWLRAMRDDGRGEEELCDLRDLVDPAGEQKNYDWDIWAKPREVEEDLRGGF